MIDRLVARLDLAVVLVLFVAGVAGFNVWLRYGWTYTNGTVRNLSDVEVVVRVTDASTGTVKGVWAIPGNSSALVVDGRPERWLFDPTPDEEALGRERSFTVELLVAGTCSVSSVGKLDDDAATLDVLPDGLAITNYDLVPTTGTPAPRAIADPCGGGPAPARGMIVNLRSRAAIVGGGFLVPPCSIRFADPGDIAGAHATEVGVTFRVPSIEAQDERWPIEPRSVTIAPDGIFDEESSAVSFDEGELAACHANAPR